MPRIDLVGKCGYLSSKAVKLDLQAFAYQEFSQVFALTDHASPQFRLIFLAQVELKVISLAYENTAEKSFISL